MNYLHTLIRMVRHLWVGKGKELAQPSNTQNCVTSRNGVQRTYNLCEYCVFYPCEIEEAACPIIKVMGETMTLQELFGEPKINRVLHISPNSIQLKVNNILVSEYNSVFSHKKGDNSFVKHYFQEPAVVYLKEEEIAAIAKSVQVLRRKWRSWDKEWREVHNIVFET